MLPGQGEKTSTVFGVWGGGKTYYVVLVGRGGCALSRIFSSSTGGGEAGGGGNQCYPRVGVTRSFQAWPII